MRRLLVILVFSVAAPFAGFAAALPAAARSQDSVANAGINLFADNCFSPFMTAAKTARRFNVAGVRYDFYDLDPFSSVAPSPVVGRAATPRTDRRCEVAFDQDHALAAVASVAQALNREGITNDADLPAQFQTTQGTALLAARRLNPKKIAVVHVGTRPGPNGIETFMNVERLSLAATQN